MRRSALAATAYVVVMIAGCNPYPAPTNVATARHWNADDAGDSGLAQARRIHLTALNGTSVAYSDRELLLEAMRSAEGNSDYPRVCASVGVAAVYLGATEEAARGLDTILAVIGSTLTDPVMTDHVLSLAGGEHEKLFKGEPYERSICFLWRGLSYLAERDLDNAAACFRGAEVEDLRGADSDGLWVSARVLAYVADLWRGAQPNPYRLTALGVPEHRIPTLDHDAVVVLAVGDGPRKVHVADRRGHVGLSYAERATAIRSARISPRAVSGVSLTLEPTDSVYVQALSRGRREMDAVLEAKARAVDAKATGADVAQGIGAVAAQFGLLGLPVAAVAAVYSISERDTAASANTIADLRTVWGLPALLFVATVKSGDGGVAIELLDESGEVVASADAARPANSARYVIMGRFR